MKEYGKRYNRLHRLASLLYELQSQRPVEHPYRKVIAQRLQHPQYEALLDLLVRQITLLNRHNRLNEGGIYQSEKADLTAALGLLKGDLRSSTMASPYLAIALDTLERKLGKQRTFRRSDMQRVLKCSKTQAHRIVNHLEACGKLKQVGGTPSLGFYYRLE